MNRMSVRYSIPTEKPDCIKQLLYAQLKRDFLKSHLNEKSKCVGVSNLKTLSQKYSDCFD